MSTNYYWRHKECRCCERYDELHIGKASGGWEFTFRGYRSSPANPKEDIQSWDDWKAHLLADGIVFDEYGAEMPVPEFIDMVEKQLAPGCKWSGSGNLLLNHIDHVLGESRYESSWPAYRDPSQHWKDNRGFAFGAGEFS